MLGEQPMGKPWVTDKASMLEPALLSVPAPICSSSTAVALSVGWATNCGTSILAPWIVGGTTSNLGNGGIDHLGDMIDLGTNLNMIHLLELFPTTLTTIDIESRHDEETSIADGRTAHVCHLQRWRQLLGRR